MVVRAHGGNHAVLRGDGTWSEPGLLVAVKVEAAGMSHEEAWRISSEHDRAFVAETSWPAKLDR